MQPARTGGSPCALPLLWGAALSQTGRAPPTGQCTPGGADPNIKCSHFRPWTCHKGRVTGRASTGVHRKKGWPPDGWQGRVQGAGPKEGRETDELEDSSSAWSCRPKTQPSSFFFFFLIQLWNIFKLIFRTTCFVCFPCMSSRNALFV